MNCIECGHPVVIVGELARCTNKGHEQCGLVYHKSWQSTYGRITYVRMKAGVNTNVREFRDGKWQASGEALTIGQALLGELVDPYAP